MSAIADLITALRAELAAADESVLSTDQLRGAVLRAVMLVNRDFKTGYVASQDAILPDLTAEDRELLLLAAVPVCCHVEIARAARRPSFKAGNIQVDRSRAVGAWRELLGQTRSEYQRLATLEVGDRMSALQCRLFERGSTAGEADA